MSTVNQRPSVHFIKPSQVSVGICGFATPAKKYRTRNAEKTTCEACKTEARTQRFLCPAETPAPAETPVHFIRQGQRSVAICGYAAPKKYRTQVATKATCEACKALAREQRFLCD